MRILVVEDERRIATYIKKGLTMKGHVVDLAHDGQEGYDLASEEDYDVVVLDLMLPLLSGEEVCRRLRENKRQMPILMLTAKGQVNDKVAGLEAGADDYLSKPFAFQELEARIKALARRPAEIKPSQIVYEDLMIDTNNYQVKRGGKPVNLSRKEYSLLEFLMRHPGQVFNKDQLTELVWEYDSEVLANTAQVYIGYLRNKIDRAFPGKKPLINTVRGFGYRLGEANV